MCDRTAHADCTASSPWQSAAIVLDRGNVGLSPASERRVQPTRSRPGDLGLGPISWLSTAPLVRSRRFRSPRSPVCLTALCLRMCRRERLKASLLPLAVTFLALEAWWQTGGCLVRPQKQSVVCRSLHFSLLALSASSDTRTHDSEHYVARVRPVWRPFCISMNVCLFIFYASSRANTVTHTFSPHTHKK